ncbi:hypothetical protein BDQ17DRAFT_1321466 [Cyathus striatus]|nr:hypothetical protein BDQ17DRAFT_1321466 [Cyathus striatus]
MPIVDTTLALPLPHYPRLPRRRPFPSFDARAAGYIASTAYPTQVPLRIQVSPGVWSDGNDCVLSAAHPAVQSLLTEGRRTLQLPHTSSELVFALAALDVFYKPGDPAHWLFWSDDKKLSTAKVVNRISLHQPPLIRSTVAWNGIPEYLCILANQHGPTWRRVYEAQPWYHIIVPPKESASSKVINLRKRKAAPGAFREPSRSPPIDEADVIDEPRSKRLRIQRPASPEKKSTIDASKNEVQDPVPSTSNQITTSATTHTPPSSHPPAQPTTPPRGPSAMLPDDAAQTEDSPRASNRKRRKAPSRYPASVRSRESSSSPTAESSDTRLRSSSHASSESTVVAPESDQGRSGSVSSSSTTAASTHSKELKTDGMITDDPQEGKPLEDSDARSEGSVDSEGMVTRGRASRTRSDDSNAKRSGEGDGSDVTPASRVKAGKASGSRARTRKATKV